MLKSNAPAIVLCHGPGGLGAVRSLSRCGIAVLAIVFEASDPVLHSRYPVQTIVVPGSNDEDKQRHVLGILNSLPNNDSVLMATSDRLVSLISDHRNDLHNKFRFKLPSKETLDALNDKSKEIDLIESLGFDVPKTIVELPATPESLEQHLRFPIIFKPHSFSKQEIFIAKNEVVRNRGELDDFYKRWENALPALLAQEVITGPDSLSWICSCTFDQDHMLLDCGIKQKLRALPAHFGGSCYAVSRENAEVLELTKELGARLKYVGHAGIEFRWDNRDQRFKYIELNPRIPANVEFDEACGLPTVWNSYKVSLDERVVCSGRRQKLGIFYVDSTADLSSLLADNTSIPKIVMTFIATLFKRTSGQYFAWDDPKPGIVVGVRFVSRTVGKVFRRDR